MSQTNFKIKNKEFENESLNNDTCLIFTILVIKAIIEIEMPFMNCNRILPQKKKKKCIYSIRIG